MRPNFASPLRALLRRKEWNMLGERARALKLPVILIAASVITVVSILEINQVTIFRELELRTYDARARLATRHPGPYLNNATNLGLVEINDQTIAFVNSGTLPEFHYGLYWPRFVYARALQELSAQGAEAVGFDVLFPERRQDHPTVTLPDGTVIGSDEYFAAQLKKSGNVILPADEKNLPDRLFLTNAWGFANITVDRDSDDVLRREQAFKDYRVWAAVIRQMAREYDLNLDKTIIETNKILFIRKAGKPITFPTDADGFIASTNFATNLPPGFPARIYPYAIKRAWSMGIVLAAYELKLDLDSAQIEPENHRIILTGDHGVSRTIPIDEDGFFYIDWALALDNPVLTPGSLQDLLTQGHERAEGRPVVNIWKGKLVMIGSTATGSELSDLGATPLDNHTHLVTKHLNVANTIISNQFITASPLWLKEWLIILMGALAAWITAAVGRPMLGILLMIIVGVVYVGLACWLFVESRYWMPIILPLGCSAGFTHVLVLTYRARAEQAEKKRVRSVFSKMLAPEVVDELLGQPNMSLGGVRREITIYFADVRGFTTLTDMTQVRANEYIQKNNLSPAEADAYNDKLAKEILDTVSAYLGTIAAVIKKHNGTLDKYIGDCVMAFWGGPVGNPKHACGAVQSAIDAQRAVLAMNLSREADNKRVQAENAVRATQGLPLLPVKPLLSMGTGINSGAAIMGLMGSADHGLNYTVFGREVNLASRLEGLSGHGRIIISESTYQLLVRDDPALAALCIERPPEDLKGFRKAVKNYEVQWRPAESPDDPSSLNLPYVTGGAETGMFAR